MKIGEVLYNTDYTMKSATKSQASISENVKQFGKIHSQKSEDMTLEEYKTVFDKKVDDLYTHPSQANMNQTIKITDAAYERMKIDPEYEEKILNSISINKRVNFGNYIPVVAVLYVDDTWEGCYGYTQGMKENNESFATTQSKNKYNDKKAKNKENLEYWEKICREREYTNELRTKNYLEHKYEQEGLNRKILATQSYEKQILSL